MRAPRLLPAISVVLVPITAVSLAAQDATGRAYCSTRTGDSVVYLTPVFDTKLKMGSPYHSKLIAYEYNQYIKGRFDYRRGGPFGRRVRFVRQSRRTQIPSGRCWCCR